MYGVGNNELSVNKKMVISAVLILVVALVFVISITNNNPHSSDNKELVHEKTDHVAQAELVIRLVLDRDSPGFQRPCILSSPFATEPSNHALI